MNEGPFWDDHFGLPAGSCYKTNDPSSGVDYVLGNPPAGFVWYALVVKQGNDNYVWSGDDLLYPGHTYDTPQGEGYSHIILCKVPADEGEITITKAATATFDREHDWLIDKNADLTYLELPADESGDALITWTVDVTYNGSTDTDTIVTGTVTVENTGDLDATVNKPTDSVATLVCGDSYPLVLAPGEDVECTFEYNAGQNETGSNTANVTGTFSDSSSFDESDTANWTATLDDELYATINVTDITDYLPIDDLDGLQDGEQDLGSVTAGNNGKFTYDHYFSYEGVGNCEELTIKNDATIDETGDSDDETVVIKTECLVFKGETATGDGKPWSGISGAPKTWFQFSPFAHTDYDIVTGKNLTDIGDFEYTDLGSTAELCFELDDPWELADVAGNVKIEVLTSYPTAYIAPGQFDHHFDVDPDDSDSFCVTVGDSTYGYAIHLDVGKWVSLGFGDLA